MSAHAQQRPQTPRFAVANAKGGTGKTTVAVNIAGALNDLGLEVLLVDMDPQGVATEALGLQDHYDDPAPTPFDALLNPAERDQTDEHVLEHAEMDLLPSTVDYLNLEWDLTIGAIMVELATDPSLDIDPAALEGLAAAIYADDVVQDEGHAAHLLDRTLAEVDGSYDVVVVDAPPYYGQIFRNVAYAAPNLIIPALPEGTSKKAVELLYDQLDVLERDTGRRIEEVAVVANRVSRPKTNETKRMLRWLQRVFDDVAFVEVYDRVALQYAFESGESIFAHEPESDVAPVFRELARDLAADADLEVAADE
jgi:chromosome partitioning protein